MPTYSSTLGWKCCPSAVELLLQLWQRLVERVSGSCFLDSSPSTFYLIDLAAVADYFLVAQRYDLYRKIPDKCLLSSFNTTCFGIMTWFPYWCSSCLTLPVVVYSDWLLSPFDTTHEVFHSFLVSKHSNLSHVHLVRFLPQTWNQPFL